MTRSIPPKSIILYADDDPDDLDLVKDVFKEYSETVELLTFPTGEEMLEYIQQMPPDSPLPCLLILDINMPRLNGFEALKKIRHIKGFEEIPAVIFTTSTMPHEKKKAVDHNAGFVTKPLNREQIYGIFDQLIHYCTDDEKKRIKRKRG